VRRWCNPGFFLLACSCHRASSASHFSQVLGLHFLALVYPSTGKLARSIGLRLDLLLQNRFIHCNLQIRGYVLRCEDLLNATVVLRALTLDGEVLGLA